MLFGCQNEVSTWKRTDSSLTPISSRCDSLRGCVCSNTLSSATPIACAQTSKRKDLRFTTPQVAVLIIREGATPLPDLQHYAAREIWVRSLKTLAARELLEDALCQSWQGSGEPVHVHHVSKVIAYLYFCTVVHVSEHYLSKLNIFLDRQSCIKEERLHFSSSQLPTSLATGPKIIDRKLLVVMLSARPRISTFIVWSASVTRFKDVSILSE